MTTHARPYKAEVNSGDSLKRWKSSSSRPFISGKFGRAYPICDRWEYQYGESPFGVRFLSSNTTHLH